MALYHLKGDVLESDAEIIIHQANCQGTFGAGIAKQIKSKYPGAYVADLNYPVAVGSRERLGNFSYYWTHDGKLIVNLYAQYGYGRGSVQTDYDAFHSGIDKLFGFVAQHQSNLKIAVPNGIGCGLAGGRWTIVSKILTELSNAYGLDVYTYKL